MQLSRCGEEGGQQVCGREEIGQQVQVREEAGKCDELLTR